MSIWIALFWFIIAVVLLYSAFQRIIKVRQITGYGLKTTGRVINLVEDYDSDSVYYIPIVEYKIHTGEVLQAKTKISLLESKINQQVEVFYQVDKPKEIIANTFFAKFGIPLMLIFSGLGILIMILIMVE